MLQNQYVIIVAGGQGVRMNSNVPKQFLLVNNLPVLMHSMQAFYNYSSNCIQILVLPEAQMDNWKVLCEKYPIDIPFILVKGGETRYHSVKNGLKAIEDENGLVGVHDAVRMLVSKEIISNSFNWAKINGSAVPYVHINDSIRIYKDNNSSVIDRNELIRIQTPQTYSVSLLKKAYQQEYKSSFTDDASLVELLGVKIHLFKGDESNIKITEPFDLLLAETILQSRNTPTLPL